jgi:hypothetical protein
MKKFTITESTPATLKYVYVVEAKNETDAMEMVLSGRVTEYEMDIVRYFEDSEYNIEEENS